MTGGIVYSNPYLKREHSIISGVVRTLEDVTVSNEGIKPMIDRVSREKQFGNMTKSMFLDFVLSGIDASSYGLLDCAKDLKISGKEETAYKIKKEAVTLKSIILRLVTYLSRNGEDNFENAFALEVGTLRGTRKTLLECLGEI
ncbi:MAG: hypothetical protein FWD01_05210 [Defluviitaleaceae bacterium]|nr:hypothetical protein [Defluviitaleaceae bacterium]